MKYIDFYLWSAIVILVGLNLLGLGVEFEREWQITWFLLSVIGWQLSRMNQS
ncbi:hypothetical protein LCGC14_0545910 [marine sediment metagenome]|uniref:Uncharacterized protein n=1 Tax=marine sediment metagenome TaxID=412755 RepID=A0A0F9UCQ9_9ZZZZ